MDVFIRAVIAEEDLRRCYLSMKTLYLRKNKGRITLRRFAEDWGSYVKTWGSSLSINSGISVGCARKLGQRVQFDTYYTDAQ
ncbi:hypothetical protein OK016_23380 [Vibrio chagasii]|nr:hypothetical protein [Vibrio chagasii]